MRLQLTLETHVSRASLQRVRCGAISRSFGWPTIATSFRRSLLVVELAANRPARSAHRLLEPRPLTNVTGFYPKVSTFQPTWKRKGLTESAGRVGNYR